MRIKAFSCSRQRVLPQRDHCSCRPHWGLAAPPFARTCERPRVPAGAATTARTHNTAKEPYVANGTTPDQPERLSQRWTHILLSAFVAGAVVFALAGALAALGAAGATAVGLHQLMA
ncbi:hypothetical protein GCM10027028_63990 [Streptomyces sundarbansensis]